MDNVIPAQIADSISYVKFSIYIHTFLFFVIHKVHNNSCNSLLHHHRQKGTDQPLSLYIANNIANKRICASVIFDGILSGPQKLLFSCCSACNVFNPVRVLNTYIIHILLRSHYAWITSYPFITHPI